MTELVYPSAKDSPSLSSHSHRDDQRSLFFSDLPESFQVVSGDFCRTAIDLGPPSSVMVDLHAQHGGRICYLRVTSNGTRQTTRIGTKGEIKRFANSNDFGSVLGINHNGINYTVWLPHCHQQFRQHLDGRIESVAASQLWCDWMFVPQIEVKVLQHAETGEIAVIPYIVLRDPKFSYFTELSSLSTSETRLYRKSTWFFASRPLDVWKYLISGSIYDLRSTPGIDKRFKCQQCAFAWYNYFGFLGKETGKRVYDLFQDEIAFSVLLDLSAEGEWGHGHWSDEMETHARFHLDGLHLLISQYERTNNLIWLEAAERGMSFAFKHLTDRFDDGGLWFLHDTLEQKAKHRIRSTIFGKNPGNSVCINTHVQALTVLHRLRHIVPANAIYGDSFERAIAALRTVLDHHPADCFYRPVAKLLMQYYAKATRNKSGWARIQNGIMGRAVLLVYERLRRLFPRWVLPRGFIDRDLTLTVGSDHYHIINLKDLLTLYRQTPLPWLRPCITSAFGIAYELVRGWGFEKAIRRSQYYFEFMDVLYLYDQLIDPLPPQEISLMEGALERGTGAYSLDFYASALVRGQTVSKPVGANSVVAEQVTE
jgi:hypothetical protein